MAGNVNRRQVLAGAAISGAAIGATGVLAACGGSSGTATASSAATVSSDNFASSASPAPAPAGALGSVTDAPVGSGFVAADAPVVVTQPSAGKFQAFSAICTHAGCLVSEVVSNQILCPCHGSVFSAEDGSVITGPATEPLAPVAIAVQGQSIVAS